MPTDWQTVFGAEVWNALCRQVQGELDGEVAADWLLTTALDALVESGALSVVYGCRSAAGEPMGEWDDGSPLAVVTPQLTEFDAVFPEGAPHWLEQRVVSVWRPVEMS